MRTGSKTWPFPVLNSFSFTLLPVLTPFAASVTTPSYLHSSVPAALDLLARTFSAQPKSHPINFFLLQLIVLPTCCTILAIFFRFLFTLLQQFPSFGKFLFSLLVLLLFCSLCITAFFHPILILTFNTCTPFVCLTHWFCYTIWIMLSFNHDHIFIH